MVHVGKLHFGPGTVFYIGGFVDMGLSGSVRGCQNVEIPLVVSNAGCPGTFGIGTFSVVKALFVVIGEGLVGIAYRAPLR